MTVQQLVVGRYRNIVTDLTDRLSFPRPRGRQIIIRTLDKMAASSGLLGKTFFIDLDPLKLPNASRVIFVGKTLGQPGGLTGQAAGAIPPW